MTSNQTPSSPNAEESLDIEIGPTQKLVPLNKDLVNYTLTFAVIANNPFQGAIVSQQELDEGKFNYMESSENQFGATISNDSGTHTQYFLALKSLDPTMARITTTKTQIQQRPTPTLNPPTKPPPASLNTPEPSDKKKQPSFFEENWKIIVVVGLIAVCAGYYYFVYSKRNKPGEQSSTSPTHTTEPLPPVMSPIKKDSLVYRLNELTE